MRVHMDDICTICFSVLEIDDSLLKQKKILNQSLFEDRYISPSEGNIFAFHSAKTKKTKNQKKKNEKKNHKKKKKT